jgi:hypothetical protein
VSTRAMPPWTAIEADVDVVCGLHQRINDVYPMHEVDVVVVGIFHQVRNATGARVCVCGGGGPMQMRIWGVRQCQGHQ